MKSLFLTLLIGFFAICLCAQNSEKRLALVVGNAAYSGGSQLKNPVNDANLIDKTLQELDFKVIKCLDASKSKLEKAIYEFSSDLKNYNVALFYYAGHGVQVNGINYLIPVDAELPDETSVKFEAVAVNYVVDEFEKYPDNTNIVILDACRDNPFRSWSRGGARGFKAMKPSSGTIIAFATSEGATAADGKGSNGLYTEHLVKQIKRPQRIVDVFNNTRVAVENASNKRQSPQEWTKLKGAFFFIEGEVNETNITSNEVTLVQGNVKNEYGNISIDSEIRGRLYIDGELKGNIMANSKANKIPKITVGKHELKLVGEKTWVQAIFVKKGRTEFVLFKNYESKKDPNILIDTRDNKKYKTIKIGNQVWMAENLAYNSGVGCYSYNDNQSNISKYGYLYTWKAAKNVCPPGWKLPSKGDFTVLVKNVGGKGKVAFEKLSFGGSSGFSAPFSGLRQKKPNYINEGKVAGFWSSSVMLRGMVTTAWQLLIMKEKEKANVYHGDTKLSYSVRCIKAD